MLNVKGKKGAVEEGFTNILLWIIFLIIAGAAVWFIIKKLSG